MSIVSISEEDLDSLYKTFSVLFQENIINRGLNTAFDRVWIALHCVEMCVYKSYVHYFSIGLTDYRRVWNNIARELLQVIGVQNITGEPLGVDLVFGDRLMKVHHLMNMLLMRYYSEHEDLCKIHVDSVKIRVKALSDIAKNLLRALTFDKNLLRYSYVCLEEKWLGELYLDKVKTICGRDVELKELEIATVELNKTGLIMYCNMVQKDFKTLNTRVINEYYIAPHLAPIWKQPEAYL